MRSRGFDEVVLPHLDAAYNYARWLSRNDTEAEDVVQDAFVRAMRFLPSLRDADARPWLFAIVRNAWYSRAARRAGSPERLPFDAARYLTDDAAIAECINAILEEDDTDLLLMALGDVARARGMAQIAKETGLGRESLYKALTPGAKPRFDTVLKVARALGVRLSAHAA